MKTKKFNYKGIFDPDQYKKYLMEVANNEKLLKNATYNSIANKSLVKEANQASFNKYMRK